MKILYFCGDPQESRSEGIAYNVRIAELTNAFRQCGHEVISFVAGENPGSQRAKRIYREKVTKIFPVKLSRVFRDAYKLIFDIKFYLKMKAKIQGIAPDFIFHRYTFLCRHGISLGKVIQKPVILEVETSVEYEEKERPYLGLGLKFVAQKIEKQVFKGADAIIAVSNALRDHLISLGTPEDKIHVIPNAVDCERFDPGIRGETTRKKYGLGQKMVLGYVGNFDPYHRVDTLLEVVAEIIQERNDIHLLLVGDGLTRSALEDRVKKNERLTPHVTFTGKVEHQEIPNYIGAFDLGILPDSNTYGSPMKIFEYMAMGKAVVAPGLAPVEEILTHDKNGLLFEPGNKHELKKTIIYLLENEKIRKRLGVDARNTILQRFTWKRTAERIVQIASTLD